MASASARPKGVRPPGGGFFRAAVRCSCLDRRPAISAVASLRCRHRLPALSSLPHRPPETALASRTASRRSHPVPAKVVPDLLRAAAGAPPQTCVSPTTGHGRRAALREPAGRPEGLPKSRSEEHTSELQSHLNLVCRLLLEKKKTDKKQTTHSRLHI